MQFFFQAAVFRLGKNPIDRIILECAALGWGQSDVAGNRLFPHGADFLYRQGGTYRLYAKYRDTHFAEKTDGYGKVILIVLDKGKQLLTKLYLGGKLTMKKGYDRPLKVIGA